jgi:hypothetical protein
VDTPSKETSDEELADLMADPELLETLDSSDDFGNNPVEVGIPPSISDENTEVDTSEESFSINDFEEDFQSGDVSEKENNTNVEEDVSPDEQISAPLPIVDEDSDSKVSITSPLPTTNGGGDVAEFRQTLASLSKQLELDRLAFLHKSLKEQGEQVPSLNEIASDITGTKLINPLGDCDQYGKRPTARLDGWVSGLSFGVSRRAKKFSK